MKIYGTGLPTYNEALKITKKNDAFYIKEGIIQGFKYAIFSYRLATYKDFLDNNAFELRGLTFIHDGYNWLRYPALTKFFNLNENEGNLYEDFKDKKIKYVQDKKDGSLITFVILPNGNIVPKTKNSFDNEQCQWVKEYLVNNHNFYEKLKSLFVRNGFQYMFEFTSRDNTIILKNKGTQLTLLQGRRTDGSYLNKAELEMSSRLMNIPIADYETHTLDELIEMKTTLEDKEGWVITYDDGQMQKIKTDWYITKHHLKESIERDNDIIRLTLEENIDDLLGELEGEEKVILQNKVSLISHYYDNRVKEVYIYRDKFFNEFNANRKDFALKFSKSFIDFSSVMKSINNKEILPVLIKDRIIKETSKLNYAIILLKKLNEKNKEKDQRC